MITKRMMVQAIADTLAGLPVEFPTEAFKEPWATAYRAVREADSDRGAALRAAFAGRQDYNEVIGAILAAEPGAREEFPALGDIADGLPAIDWLWPDWIPRGMISLLGAVPGAGKSYVALDLARRIIAGGEWPDGAPIPHPGGNILWVDAEAVPQITLERARRWELDLGHLFLMLPGDQLLMDLAEPADQDRLVEMTAALAPELLVIDSLSTISLRSENAIEDVREVLSFLNAVAQDARCGLLLIHHLRKRAPLPLLDILDIDDFRGSSHIVAMARSVLGLCVVQTGPDVDRNGPRRLEVVKTNLARYPAPIGVEFRPLEPTGVWLEYGGAPSPYREPTKEREAAHWLLQLLEEGGEPMRPKDIVGLAEVEGFSRSLIYRARQALGGEITNTVGRQSPNNRWALSEWGEGAEAE